MPLSLGRTGSGTGTAASGEPGVAGSGEREGDWALSKHPTASSMSPCGMGAAAVRPWATEFCDPGSAGAVSLQVGTAVAFTIASLHAVAIGADAGGVAFAMVAFEVVTIADDVWGGTFTISALDAVAIGCNACAVGPGTEDDIESLFALAQDAAAGAGFSAMGMASGRELSVSAAVCRFVLLCGFRAGGRAGFGGAASCPLGIVSAWGRLRGAIGGGVTGSGAGITTGLGRNGKNEEKLEAGDEAGSLRATPLAFAAAGGPAFSSG